jgi:hypothetical protein
MSVDHLILLEAFFNFGPLLRVPFRTSCMLVCTFIVPYCTYSLLFGFTEIILKFMLYFVEPVASLRKNTYNWNTVENTVDGESNHAGSTG